MDPLFNNSLFKLVEMKDKEYDEVNMSVLKTYPKSCILFIYEIKNDKLQSEFGKLKSELTQKYPVRTELLYHGTQKRNILSISQNGFDPIYNTRSAFGKGSYFSKFGDYSKNYTDDDRERISYMFIADVIVGRTKVGSSRETLDTSKYENFTDHNSSMYVTPYRYGGIPKYIIAFYKYT